MHWLFIPALILSSLLSAWDAAAPLALILALTGLAGAAQLARGKWQPAAFPAPLSWCFLLFTLWAGLSALWSQTPFDTWRAFSVWLLLPVWAWMLSSLEFDRLRRVFFASCGAVFLLSLVAYAQLALGDVPDNMRPPSLFANPNTFAALIVAVLLPLQYLFLAEGPALSKKWIKTVAGLFLCLMLGALVLSASRIALIGYIGLSAIQIFLLRDHLRRHDDFAWRYVASAVFTCVVVNLIGGGIAQERFRIIAEPMSYSERLLVWETAWKSFEAQNLLGAGFGALHVPYAALRGYDDTTYGQFAHSDVLQYLVELGPIGLLLALSVFGSFMWMTVARWREGFKNAKNATWFAAVSFGILVTALASAVTYLLYLPIIVLVTAMLFGLWAALYWCEAEPLPQTKHPVAALLFLAAVTLLSAMHLSARLTYMADRDLRRFSLERHYVWNLWAGYLSFDINPQVLIEWSDVLLSKASQDKNQKELASIDQTLDRLERLQPSLPSLWLMRARLVLVNGDADGAERDLKQALALDPTFLPARVMLGRLYSETGRDAEIAPLYEEGLKYKVTEAKYGAGSMKDMKVYEGNLPRLTKSRY